MSKNQNTPCGCRCNSANDTRLNEELRELVTGLHEDARVELRNSIADDRAIRKVLGGDLYDGILAGTAKASNAKQLARIAGFVLNVLDSAFIDKCIHDLRCAEPDEVGGLRDLARLARLSAVSESVDGAEVGVDIAFGFCELFSLAEHCSSPVVAESEADTSDAPAMTVQEGGSGDAAPDLGTGSVSVFRSRFVVAGRYVYDRDLNKVIDGADLCFGPDVLVEMLNAGHADARAYSWEDAK